MIYSELRNVNQSLEKLDTTMRSAVVEIQKIEANTRSIAESNKSIANATEAITKDSAVIAHNTAVTAFYAKKNAELTDALGYMVAFN